MIEFSEDFNTVFTGRAAAQQRGVAILKTEKGIIPFQSFGVEYNVFGVSTQPLLESARKALSTLGYISHIESGHIVVLDIDFNLSTLEAI